LAAPPDVMWLLNTLLVLLNHGTAPVLACFSNSATTTKIIQGVADFVCDQNATRVEFEHLGAFSADYWKCMPETPEVLAPRLLYYDRRHSSQPIELEWNSLDFAALGKVSQWPRKVLVFTHGFVDSITRHDSTVWMDPAREKLVRRGNGVILLDWSLGADAVYNYAQAASNTRVVGRMLAFMLNNMKSYFASRAKSGYRAQLSLHLVGHSLGAHVCGQAGDYYRQISGGELIERIDGLDPAGPLFLDQRAFASGLIATSTAAPLANLTRLIDENEKKKEKEDEANSEVLSYFDSFQTVFNQWVASFNEETPITQTGRLSEEQSERFKIGIRDTIKAQQDPVPDSSRLDRGDAQFVTVIHTNAFGFGVYENIGHVDFWPNGGILQQGCLPLLHVIDETMSKCSHRYSHKLWEQSLNEASRITIYKCGENLEPYNINNQTCTNKSLTMKFGFQAENDEEGVYFVDTSRVKGKPSNLLEVIFHMIFLVLFIGVISLFLYTVYTLSLRRRAMSSRSCLNWRWANRYRCSRAERRNLNATTTGEGGGGRGVLGGAVANVMNASSNDDISMIQTSRNDEPIYTVI